ncbi:MAG: magnesium transporter CorA [Sulfobacillus acidophilus]|uniref:Magnesium transporter CorA n=1 Tax=Sulfobacillus acidophilus TaxID=53633 RepID=A0A2T2WDQ5_9FIRM|nr:MAG: magnesium transporter CorA [Sulfobacillus acidophilus]
MAQFVYSVGHETHFAEKWPADADTVWIDLDPTDRDRVTEVVNRLYSAHPKVIEHLLEGRSHRPDLLIEDDAVSFMLALIPISPEDSIRHLSFIVGRKFLVTAHLTGQSGIVEHARRHVLNNAMMDNGIDFALYQVLHGHVAALKQMANHLDQKFETLHRLLLRHPYHDLSPDILALRRETMAANHILDPEGAVFELLKSSDFPFVQKENRPYFQDVAFLMDEVVSEVQQIRDGLAEMVEAYTSLQSNEINKVMWFLTIVSTMSLPATTIASIYGMNFVHMPDLRWRYGYWYSLFLMFVVSLLMLLWMKIRRRRG